MAEVLPAAVAALAGTMVTRFVIDDSLTVVCAAAGREVRLRIDGVGRLERAGRVVDFAPDADPAGLAPVLALLHERVHAVSIAADGALALECAGARLVALGDEHAVSWAVSASDGSSATCIAEGKVVWN